ncbi:MAG: hypothetical protein LBC81_01720 [Tannerellaceae bacterium]|nr:hypothetical protein [Tannerellaceae bacterium]
MNLEIIAIGDELLIGQVIDSNSAWMARRLEPEGFKVTRKAVVGDNRADILSALSSSLGRVAIVLLTGGLGPTKDDVTKSALSLHFNTPLYFSSQVYSDIERLFALRGRAMNELTRSQAMTPAAAIPLRNPAGTAPGLWFDTGGKVTVAMPGVPLEMEQMMTGQIIPRLKSRFARDAFIAHHTLTVTGLTESALAIRLAPFEAALPPAVKLAYLPQSGRIRLRLTVQAQASAEAERLMKESLARIERELSAGKADNPQIQYFSEE